MLPPDSKHYTVLFQERLPFITARCSHFSLCQEAKLLNVFCRTEKNLLRQLYVAFKVPKEWVANFQLLTFGIKWAMPDLSWFFWGSFRIDIFPFPCLLFKYHGVFHKCWLIDWSNPTNLAIHCREVQLSHSHVCGSKLSEICNRRSQRKGQSETEVWWRLFSVSTEIVFKP